MSSGEGIHIHIKAFIINIHAHQLKLKPFLSSRGSIIWNLGASSHLRTSSHKTGVLLSINKLCEITALTSRRFTPDNEDVELSEVLVSPERVDGPLFNQISCLLHHGQLLAMPLGTVATQFITHRHPLISLHRCTISFISLPSAQFLASCVAGCFRTSGMAYPFSSIVTPSSRNKLCTFHFPAPLIFGSIYSIVYGMVDHIPTAARI